MYIISVDSLCMYVCQTITFESLDGRSSYLHIPYIPGNTGQVFVYEGHRVKVMVTSKKRPMLSCHPYDSVKAGLQLPRQRVHCIVGAARG